MLEKRLDLFFPIRSFWAQYLPPLYKASVLGSAYMGISGLGLNG